MTTRDTPEAALAAALLRVEHGKTFDVSRWPVVVEANRQKAAAILAALDGWTLVRDAPPSLRAPMRATIDMQEATIARLRMALEAVRPWANAGRPAPNSVIADIDAALAAPSEEANHG